MKLEFNHRVFDIDIQQAWVVLNQLASPKRTTQLPPVEQLPHLVKYERDNGEEWFTPEQTLRRGKDDCEGLACLFAASLRQAGVCAIVNLVRVSDSLIHVVVIVPRGSVPSWEYADYPFDTMFSLPGDWAVIDPSVLCGMPITAYPKLRRTPGPFTLNTSPHFRGMDISFVNGVVAVARRLNTDPAFLLGVMYFETGGKFTSDITPMGPASRLSDAVLAKQPIGLLQFVPSTRRGLGITDDRAFAAMAPLEQLVYVERYLKPYNLRTFADVASAVFYPAARGRSDYVVGREGSAAYDQNAALDKNKDKVLTFAEYLTPAEKSRIMATYELWATKAKATRSPGEGIVLAEEIKAWAVRQSPPDLALITLMGQTITQYQALLKKQPTWGWKEWEQKDTVNYATLLELRIRSFGRAPIDRTPTVDQVVNEVVKPTLTTVADGASSPYVWVGAGLLAAFLLLRR